MIWREKRVLLAVLGLLLAANTIFFFTYRVQYQNRLEALEERQKEVEEQLTRARSQRLATQGRIAAYRQVERDIRQVYDRHWATEEERLTALIAEVKRLAAASGMPSKATSYTKAERENRKGGVGAETIGITFSVKGSYEQVRRLINLLELSDQFVIVDQIALSSAENEMLTLTLQLKTLFRDTSPTAKES